LLDATLVAGFAWSGRDWVLALVVVAVYLGVIWMVIDILRRRDFSGWMKLLWIVIALTFSLAALIVYIPWVRRTDYSSR
jgi:hypothetical protein